MKRILSILAILGLLFIPMVAHAVVGSCTAAGSLVEVKDEPARFVLTLTCTGGTGGDAGAIADYTINPTASLYSIAQTKNGIKGWYLHSVETNPGAVAPTPNYDIYLYNADKSYDLAQGLLTNRHTSNTETVYLGSVGEPIIYANWVLSFANNAVASSVIVATLVFKAE